jgi:hypothetical protein
MMRDTQRQHGGVLIFLFFLLRKNNRLKKRAIWKEDGTVLQNKFRK